MTLISRVDHSGVQTKGLVKMRIKGYRFPCEVCGEGKIVSSVQVFFRANGEVGYARARHLGANRKFYYHQQSLDYVNRKLQELSNIERGQEVNIVSTKSIEHNIVNSGLKDNMARDVGFEPTRPFDHRLSRPAPYQAWGIPHIQSLGAKPVSANPLCYCSIKPFWQLKVVG